MIRFSGIAFFVATNCSILMTSLPPGDWLQPQTCKITVLDTQGHTHVSHSIYLQLVNIRYLFFQNMQEFYNGE